MTTSQNQEVEPWLKTYDSGLIQLSVPLTFMLDRIKCFKVIFMTIDGYRKALTSEDIRFVHWFSPTISAEDASKGFLGYVNGRLDDGKGIPVYTDYFTDEGKLSADYTVFLRPEVDAVGLTEELAKYNEY
jgi:hypothetical protein